MALYTCRSCDEPVSPCPSDWRVAETWSTAAVVFPTDARSIADIPQAHRDAWSGTSRAAGTLLGRVGGDSLGLEAVDAAVRIVARDLVKPGVDDGGDARYGDRRLGDIGRDDDATPA